MSIQTKLLLKAIVEKGYPKKHMWFILCLLLWLLLHNSDMELQTILYNKPQNPYKKYSICLKYFFPSWAFTKKYEINMRWNEKVSSFLIENRILVRKSTQVYRQKHCGNKSSFLCVIFFLTLIVKVRKLTQSRRLQSFDIRPYILTSKVKIDKRI